MNSSSNVLIADLTQSLSPKLKHFLFSLSFFLFLEKLNEKMAFGAYKNLTHYIPLSRNGN